MMKCSFNRFGIIVLSTFFMFLTGCASTQQAKFYTLNSMGPSEIQGQSKADRKDIALGIGPIEFPQYLNRPHIVTRTSTNEIQLAEFHRWAGSLYDDFPRVLGENLSSLLGTNLISFYPWGSSVPVDYQITLSVTRFDGEPGGSVTLSVRLKILGGEEKNVLVNKTLTSNESTKAEGYEELVAAYSMALAGLSEKIAEEIRVL